MILFGLEILLLGLTYFSLKEMFNPNYTNRRYQIHNFSYIEIPPSYEYSQENTQENPEENYTNKELPPAYS